MRARWIPYLVVLVAVAPWGCESKKRTSSKKRAASKSSPEAAGPRIDPGSVMRRVVTDRDGKRVSVTTFRARARTAKELAALERGCKAKVYDECIALGLARQSAAKYAAAERVWKVACDAGQGKACFHLGSMLANPYLKLGRDAEAVKLMRKACRLGGHPAACYFLAGWYDKGRLGLPKDAAKARTHYEKACEAGHYWACKKVGRKPAPR